MVIDLIVKGTVERDFWRQFFLFTLCGAQLSRLKGLRFFHIHEVIRVSR
jgi:hypothetical protein